MLISRLPEDQPLPPDFHILGEQPAATDGEGGRTYASAKRHQQDREGCTSAQRHQQDHEGCDCFRIPHAFYCASVTRDLVPGYGQTAAGVADADDQRKADAR